VLRIASARAGETVAETLRRRNRERIAYIAPTLDLHWARSRFEGMKRFQRHYGGTGSRIDLFTFGEYTDLNDLQLALFDLEPEAVRALYGDRLSGEQLDGMVALLKRVRLKGLPAAFSSDLAARTLRALAGRLAQVAAQEHDPFTFEIFLERLLHLAGDTAVLLYMRPFFEKILAAGDHDAWVCADEKTARAALTFVREKGVRVPDDIAMVTFENWREVYERQLTTYDFNMNGIVQRALLLIADRKTLAATPPISEVGGYVVERRTTRW
jgi:DNA-binding LacI/PurR family transcriptional regulator